MMTACKGVLLKWSFLLVLYLLCVPQPLFFCLFSPSLSTACFSFILFPFLNRQPLDSPMSYRRHWSLIGLLALNLSFSTTYLDTIFHDLFYVSTNSTQPIFLLYLLLYVPHLLMPTTAISSSHLLGNVHGVIPAIKVELRLLCV